jgi:hypothetical protein
MQIDSDDLVIVSDTGTAYVVHFIDPTANPPATIVVIPDADVGRAAVKLANHGTLVANLPQNALGGGCTCFLLNLRDLLKTTPGANADSYGVRSLAAPRVRRAKRTAKKTTAAKKTAKKTAKKRTQR